MGLNCSNNALTSLDVSGNEVLSDYYFSCEENTYKITAVNGIFNLKDLPGNFDVSRATDWKGATVKDGKLIIDSSVDKVTYTYYCGSDKSKATEFTLLVTHTTKSDAAGSPMTGDNNNLILWFALLLACGTAVGVVGGVAVVRNRRKCNR